MVKLLQTKFQYWTNSSVWRRKEKNLTLQKRAQTASVIIKPSPTILQFVPHACVILASVEPHKVISSVPSTCLSVWFYRLPPGIWAALVARLYSTRTPPGWAFKSMTLRGVSWVPGITPLTVGKNAFLCWSLVACQSAQILSIKPWWRKNSGALAASAVHMVPLIKQWTVSCRFPLKANSNFDSKSPAGVFNTSCTAILSGGRSLNCLDKHSKFADGTSFHTASLKGPVCTHQRNVTPPFPPKPLSPVNQTSCASPRHAVPETWLQSQ